MLWDEVYLDRTPAAAELAEAMGGALGVPSERVRVVADLENAPAARVIIELTEGGGEFVARCGIYPESQPEVGKDTFARDLARRLDCRVLTSSMDANPYVATLVHPDGRTEEVSLDAKALDKNDVIIVGSRRGMSNISAQQGAARIAETPKRAKLRDVSLPGARPRPVSSNATRVNKSVRELIELYLEAPMTTAPGNAEQESAFGALSRAVLALPREEQPTPEMKIALRGAAARVRLTWPRDLQEAGTPLGNLLAVADLLDGPR